MKIEEMKKRLHRVKELDEKVNEKLIRLHELKQLAGCTGGMSCDKECVQTSLSGSKLEEIVCKIVDLEKEINQDTDTFIDYRDAVLQELRKLIGRERDVLMRKYIMYQSAPEIASALNVNLRTVQRIHKAGLKELCQQ